MGPRILVVAPVYKIINIPDLLEWRIIKQPMLYHCTDNGTVEFLWASCLHVSCCWHGPVNDWTHEGGSHDVLVTSLCEPRPRQGGTNVGFMNYRSWWRQRKQELRLQQCPEPPTCSGAPIHEDHLSHSNACEPPDNLEFYIFCYLTYFCPFHFNGCWKCITLSHITRSINLDFYECIYLCAYMTI